MRRGPTDELILAHTNRSLNVYGVGHYFASIPNLGITLLRYRICINRLVGSPGQIYNNRLTQHIYHARLAEYENRLGLIGGGLSDF